MEMSWTMMLGCVATLALPILGAVVMVAYLRRNRQLLNSQMDRYLPTAVLDSLDQVHLRLDALNRRLERVEKCLEPEWEGSHRGPEGEELR